MFFGFENMQQNFTSQRKKMRTENIEKKNKSIRILLGTKGHKTDRKSVV